MKLAPEGVLTAMLYTRLKADGYEQPLDDAIFQVLANLEEDPLELPTAAELKTASRSWVEALQDAAIELCEEDFPDSVVLTIQFGQDDRLGHAFSYGSLGERPHWPDDLPSNGHPGPPASDDDVPF